MFGLWKEYQRAPERCEFTETRQKLLYARLRTKTGEQLLALVRYAFEAEVPEARFWRGGNPEQREYLQLENLLRVGTLDSRVENAIAWLAGEDPHDPEGPQDDAGEDGEDGEPEYDARSDPRAPAPPPGPPPRPPSPPAGQPVRGRALQLRPVKGK